MALATSLQEKYNDKKSELFIAGLQSLVSRSFFRRTFAKRIDKKLKEDFLNDKSLPKSIQDKKYAFFSALLECVVNNLEKGYMSKESSKKLIEVFVRNSVLGNNESLKVQEEFEKKHGMKPSSFIVLSPTQKCNLTCTGCYASAKAEVSCSTLPFETVDRIVGECHDIFGNRFMTISGGEPFLYNDKGKTLFDIWEKYSDMFFLVYTNGTLITKETATRLAKLSNVTPAISVEGFKNETDERRGKGTFDKILKAFQNLREVGVPFGISVTATNKNVDILLQDSFYDFFFKKQGATYMWQFQLMPIGRAVDGSLMITPKQRVELYKKWKYLMKDKKYCIADFWCSGELSNGCIAYGRNGGYFYIDWDGKIMPCVFVPYYVNTVDQLFKKGKTLADALKVDLFKRGRDWQDEYGLSNLKNPGNWLMPCSIRDHYENFKENIITKNAKAEDKAAEEALKSKKYLATLKKFDDELEKLTEPIWKEELKN